MRSDSIREPSCPSCGAGEIVVKKFTLPFRDGGDQTVLDYFCPTCGRLDTIACREDDWRRLTDRWKREPAASDEWWRRAASDRGAITSNTFRVVVCAGLDPVS